MAAPISQPFSPALSRQPNQQFGLRDLDGVENNHLGRDYSTPLGMPVRAVQNGKVVSLGGSRKHAWGFWLHENTGDGDVIEYHVLRDDPKARWKVGDIIRIGDVIGYTGNTEKYFPHHHFGWNHNGKYQNPAILPWKPEALTAVTNSHPFTDPEEDDMYDQKAQDTLLTAIADDGRPLRFVSNGGGLILIGPGGKRRVFAERAYVDLIMAAGLAGPTTKLWTDAQIDFICSVLADVAPDPVVTKQVDAILSLSPEQAKRIAEGISSELNLVLTDDMLHQLTEAARNGAEDGVRSLSFVTVVQ